MALQMLRNSADDGRLGEPIFQPGEVLAGRYRVEGLLGRGEVYRVVDGVL